VIEIPDKPAYKGSEVCQYTDTQPYVLHFWASEFPQLRPRKSAGGQALYSRHDIDLILRIKQLLYEDEYTIADARRLLDEEQHGEASAESRPTAAPAETTAPEPSAAGQPDVGTVPRQRYEDAVDEITHLRLKLKEAEALLRRKEAALRHAEQRRATAIERLEHLLERLG